MPISLDPSIKFNSKTFANKDDFLDLPFPYLHLNWHNGNVRDAVEKGAQHFGGFQRGVEDITADLESMNLTALPSSFTPPADWLSDDNSMYKAQSTRNLFAAPIIAKVDWYETDEINPKTGKLRLAHRLDFLVYLADWNATNKVLEPWGPAVISAKGLAATAIEDIIRNWDKDTAGIRAECAKGIDPRFFYHNIGTFGKERVEKKTEGRTIIVCQFKKPDGGWTEELLSKFFVGSTIAAVMVDLEIQAADWREDTRQNRQKKGGKQAAGPTGQPLVSFGTPPENFADDPADNSDSPF